MPPKANNAAAAAATLPAKKRPAIDDPNAGSTKIGKVPSTPTKVKAEGVFDPSKIRRLTKITASAHYLTSNLPEWDLFEVRIGADGKTMHSYKKGDLKPPFMLVGRIRDRPWLTLGKYGRSILLTLSQDDLKATARFAHCANLKISTVHGTSTVQLRNDSTAPGPFLPVFDGQTTFSANSGHIAADEIKDGDLVCVHAIPTRSYGRLGLYFTKITLLSNDVDWTTAGGAPPAEVVELDEENDTEVF
ncbi:hypothetical protein Rhopal_005615-T1 [Rhodotorula paludigena]|uniref:Uncharacterized protein n=1 Tax=Rhodotorula paludigena TaxID=86838 RepID=A0AAV5GTM3_9BASI|nr:hypothetical protein Rhopal_005615-T1 [Rhodotorula paludigena]